MNEATLRQARKILGYAEEVPHHKLQRFEESGILSDFFMADPFQVDRIALQCFLGIRTIVKCAIPRYNWSLRQLIEAGRYRKIDKRIWEKLEHRVPFPKTEGNFEIHLIRFGRRLSVADVLSMLENWRLRPADLAELLSVGKEPLLGPYASILSLGSWLKDSQTHFPSISNISGAGRDLVLTSVTFLQNTVLPDYTHFAAVPY